VAIQIEREVGEDDLAALYESVGWEAYTRSPDALVEAIGNSSIVVTARDEHGELIGLARGLSDDASIVYLQDILVRPDHQRTGVGRRLLTICLERYRHVRQKVFGRHRPGRSGLAMSRRRGSRLRWSPPLRTHVHAQPAWDGSGATPGRC
jgi:GNAT superfamily N-acetyltransferase